MPVTLSRPTTALDWRRSARPMTSFGDHPWVAGMPGRGLDRADQGRSGQSRPRRTAIFKSTASTVAVLALILPRPVIARKTSVPRMASGPVLRGGRQAAARRQPCRRPGTANGAAAVFLQKFYGWPAILQRAGRAAPFLGSRLFPLDSTRFSR